MLPQLTIRHTLPVVVTLRIGDILSNKLEINLILDIAHQNESSHNTLSLRCSHRRADLAIPDVVCARKQCSDCAGCHGEQDRVLVVWHHCPRADPVRLARVAKVFRVLHDIVH